jgi:hypothetical protein
MAQWAHDGTQDPGPMPMLGDPLSGLVTGSQSQPEPVTVRVVEPPPPDISEVRRAVQSVLGDDSELIAGDAPDVVQTAEIPAPAASPEQVPEPPAQPEPPKAVAPAARPAPPAAIPPARLETPVVSNDEPKAKGSSSTTGVVIALVLVAVMVVLGIVVIGSLVETITSLFD